MEFIERDGVNYQVEGHSLYGIINIVEPMVLDAMREAYAADPTICRCSLCVEDVYALSLNGLAPRYIQPTSLPVYETSQKRVTAEEVRARVGEAVARIKAGPKH